jgi:predicted nucleic acid-binding protein
MIVVDTSILIDALTGAKHSAAALRQNIERGERMLIPAIVLYEWLRGPRRREELAAQEALFPTAASVPFGSQEAVRASALYKAVRRPRGREIDLAIAAHAIVKDAELWTLNTGDFRDIPGLRLFIAPA